MRENASVRAWIHRVLVGASTGPRGRGARPARGSVSNLPRLLRGMFLRNGRGRWNLRLRRQS